MVRADEEETKDLTECDPGDGDNRCYIVFIEDYRALLKENANLKERLKACEVD